MVSFFSFGFYRSLSEWSCRGREEIETRAPPPSLPSLVSSSLSISLLFLVRARLHLFVVADSIFSPFPFQAWDAPNLFNIWQRNIGPLQGQYSFARTKDTIYQNQFFARKQLRGYWGQRLKERGFRRWYLPASLPLITSGERTNPNLNIAVGSATKFSRPGKEGGRRQIEKEQLYRYHAAQAPIGPFMFREIERRLDHVLFRACFATSQQKAAQMIREGHVRLNGNIEKQYQIRLLPGDFLEVNPAAVPFLRRPSVKEEASKEEEDDDTVEPPISSTSSVIEEDSTTTADESSSSESPLDQPPHPSQTDSKPKSAFPRVTIKRSPPTSFKPLTPTHFPPEPTDAPNSLHFHLPAYSGPSLFVPAYIQPNWEFCTVTYLRHPTARHNYCEIPSPFDAKGDVMRAGWEWYQKRKIRMKTHSGGLFPGGIDARARAGKLRGPETRRSGVHEEFY
ncbi:hypothetical protein BDY24DRAFT_345159 [Mrakia frigida]|uniref:mitochondrial 37S ribosomal protein uS4m NAM9 n=1 Tax=Mrakia frigida TaxID=29902 RepID=UPI003FCC0CC9